MVDARPARKHELGSRFLSRWNETSRGIGFWDFCFEGFGSYLGRERWTALSVVVCRSFLGGWKQICGVGELQRPHLHRAIHANLVAEHRPFWQQSRYFLAGAFNEFRASNDLRFEQNQLDRGDELIGA